MQNLTIAPAGQDAVLIEFEEIGAAELSRLSHLFENAVIAAIPGDRSILLLLHPGASIGDLERIISGTAHYARTPGRTHTIRIGCSEDNAPDLPALLSHAGMDRDAFYTQLTQLRLTARFLGFRAGFAYLEGVPESWQLPRRPSPRERVPAGSFGIGGARAGFYPVDSPGGWNLIGRTDVSLWDPWRDPPGMIAPGDEIVVVPTDEPILSWQPESDPRRRSADVLFDVLAGGQKTIIVGPADTGRLRRGLSPGGSFDEESASWANAAVGNEPHAPLLECVLVGPDLLFRQNAVASWYGADAGLELAGRPVSTPRQFAITSGQRLQIGRLRGGARGWLALRGGVGDPGAPFAIEPFTLGKGDSIDGAGMPSGPPHVRVARGGGRSGLALLARRGPHVTAKEVDSWIRSSVWKVQAASDRLGVRLRSGPAPAAAPATIASCGMRAGTIEWTPDGELVVMGPDHPITGGYLQVATLDPSSIPELAQLAPGDELRILLR